MVSRARNASGGVLPPRGPNYAQPVTVRNRLRGRKNRARKRSPTAGRRAESVRNSCGLQEEVAAAPANPGLALPLVERGADFFREQLGEQEHGVARGPGERGGVVGGA